MLVRPAFGRVDVDALLVGYRARPFNYRPDGERNVEAGWHTDARRERLPAERPGDPEPGGPWETARRLTDEYTFSDPELVRGHFDRTTPLENRTMVLELRVWTLRIFVGVRVTETHDERRELDGRPARVWGWTYGTLKGHVEQGERTFNVVKWLDTGEVEFVTRAFSRPAATNPVIRLGYRILGRPRQRLFVESSAERTVALVEARLGARPK